MTAPSCFVKKTDDNCTCEEPSARVKVLKHAVSETSKFPATDMWTCCGNLAGVKAGFCGYTDFQITAEQEEHIEREKEAAAAAIAEEIQIALAAGGDQSGKLSPAQIVMKQFKERAEKKRKQELAKEKQKLAEEKQKLEDAKTKIFGLNKWIVYGVIGGLMLLIIIAIIVKLKK
jgi:hypothetical protein